MRFRFSALFLPAAVLIFPLAGDVFSADFKFPGQTLTVPAGFTVEMVASSPLVDRPVSGSFDELGRLYVTDSSGSNDKPDKQLTDLPHRVVRLEDVRGNGRFEKTTVFADKMMFPEGCLWHDGSLYVAAPPSIWKLTDTNNDGVADLREEWHQGKTLTGCANDLHGPYLGLDGWIYWCKGAFAEQTYEISGHPFVTKAAHIFRAPENHSTLEPVLTGGMDNPVGLAFTAGGERILCGTFFVTHEPGHRDGLIHAIYGGVYGKINAVTDDHKKTGDLMPIMTQMGPAAPCSVIRYESSSLGPEWQKSLLTCSFNLRKVIRSVMVPDGATFKTIDSDFLTSDNPDFHPTEIIEDADGSLLVFNTGGWYKICCPTSQLSKPDVLGAIYRIRRVDSKPVEDPRGLKLRWDRGNPALLASFLGDPRTAVRKRAISELAKAGPAAISATAAVLKQEKSAETRRNAVWALTRVDGAKAREAVRTALEDKDATVRHAALSSISLWRDQQAEEGLLTVVGSSEPSLQRVAAEALGRMRSQKSVAALLRVASTPRDRVLEHSIIFALLEINAPAATALGLNASSPSERRAALIALDQMDGGNLAAETVAGFLAADDAALRQTAAWAASHHPAWGDALAGFFRSRLEAAAFTDAAKSELTRQLALFAHSASLQEIMAAEVLKNSRPETIRVVLDAMAQSGLKPVPPSWKEAVETALSQKEPLVLKAAVGTARSLSAAGTNAPSFSSSLLAIGRDASREPQLRLQALASVRGGLRKVEPDLFAFLCENINPSNPVSTRSEAVTVLARAKLTEDQLVRLTDVVRTAGPLEISKLLPAFEHSNSERLGLRLFEALKGSSGLASLRADLLKPLAAKYPPAVQHEAEELIALLNADAEKQKSRIDDLLPQLKDGDLRRGQTVFNSQKAACSTCHAIGYLGGHVGPDLTSIGQARTERDLLESILFPSASFVRSYEPFIVTTKSEETFSGVLKKDASDEIILATGPTTEAKIARSDITEIRPGTVSIMPAGLDQQLSKQELADLLAFLKSTRWGPH